MQIETAKSIIDLCQKINESDRIIIEETYKSLTLSVQLWTDFVKNVYFMQSSTTD